MSENKIDNIKNYLKAVEEEQKQIEDKEKKLSEASVEERIPQKEDVVEPQKPPTDESEKEGFDWKTPAQEVEKEELPEEIDFANDLLDKTEKVIRRYSIAYITQNIENSVLMLEFLEKTSLLLPYNTDFVLRGRIEKNIESFRKSVSEVDKVQRKAESKKVLEDFLQDLDKALRRYSKPQIEKDSKRAQYDYNLLLERKENLPRGNPTYEMVVSKRFGELEKRINEVTTEIDAKKECEVIELHINNFLKRADKESFESLYKDYRQLIDEYRLLEEKLDKAEMASVKNGLYRCKDRLEKIKSRVQKETRKKHVIEEQKKKEEYLGIRTFWNEYIGDLRIFIESLKSANPSQYFSLYDKYSSMLGVFYNLVRNDMISKEESQQATHILENIEKDLEVLRKGI